MLQSGWTKIRSLQDHDLLAGAYIQLWWELQSCLRILSERAAAGWVAAASWLQLSSFDGHVKQHVMHAQ